MIDYQKILNQNMIRVLKDILNYISLNGYSDKNQLYITFSTKNNDTNIPMWLRKKYPEEMTIIIQYEYYDLKVEEDYFKITLSFNNIKTLLKINYNSVISFADPYSNFGLILKNKKIKTNLKNKKNEKKLNKDNVLDLSKYRKS